jgi:hypothetical protein
MAGCRSNSTVTDVPARKKTIRNSQLDMDKLKRSMKLDDDEDSKDLDHYYQQTKNMISTMDDNKNSDFILQSHIEGGSQFKKKRMDRESEMHMKRLKQE